MRNFVSGRYFCQTDIGKVRISNEDRVIALTNAKGYVLLIVCDGMGGAKKGDFAASLAINSISDAFLSHRGSFAFRAHAMHWLASVIRKANSLIYEEAQNNEKAYKGMGTTLTVVLIVGGYYVLAQIGDSRCYTINDGQLTQLSHDQTYVAYLYRTGQITKEEMLTHPKRHVLMNALGIYPSIEIDMHVYNYNQEMFLLCSDGLYNNVDNMNLEAIMKSNDSVEQKVKELIALANENGGSDNIGIVLWEADK